MTKDEIIANVSEYSDQPRLVVKSVLQSYFVTIEKCLGIGHDMPLGNLGTFKVKDVPAHAARNPKTGEALHIPDGKRVKFAASSVLKNAVSSS